ncbi:MAG: NIPSNAP family protein [Labedaea sp.]
MPRVVELRQYTLHPGRRDELIELFDREFVESQEALGIRVLGQFRDLGAPDRFVWVRDFEDMTSRAAALTAFYSGPAWQAHRQAANATMIDSDDVLLLRPFGPGFAVDPAVRDVTPASLVLATVYQPAEPAGFGPLLTGLQALLEKAGAILLGQLETEPAANNFPALPVRTGENVFVWLASFPDEQAIAEWTAIEPDLPARVTRLELAPTARSLLR